MKKIAIILTMLLMAVATVPSVYAGPSQDKKAAREAKKKVRRDKLEQQYQQTASLVDSKSFVLEADWLSNQYGSRVPVTPNLNFIKVDSSDVVLQVGSNYGAGYNGVGGITAEGRLTSWKVHRNDKKLTYHVQANVMTSIGVYDISLTVGSDGHAYATITGMRRGQLNYTGTLVPIDQSHAYKGQTSY
ncbi:MAG TPA: DUF4251 domain-containing protein [Bacteroidales bacterium]|nr:DUF4251 domain-containing protein [Bacteroidales bacterium]